ncbi:nucleotide sugar dehydrogenase [bacterium]|nr:nucleotide sugar dehydrogenase [bacterium]
MSEGATRHQVAVIGLGYVGLPVALEAARSGLSVVGLDHSETIVRHLNEGHSHIDDISDRDIHFMLSNGFQASSDAGCLAAVGTIVICVPTPLTKDLGPNLEAVEAAGRSIAENLQADQLIVLESTSYPGTTEEVLQPILESTGLTAGKDFALAYSPERIDPGNQAFRLRNTPKVVGGLSDECTRRAVEFYALLVDEVVVAAGIKEAEMTKLLENTYRHINIALVNEMAQFCAELDIDLWDAIRCAQTKPFGFSAFYPGPGVGGHCIPIDPNYLSHQVQSRLGYSFRFVELAQEINAGMPGYVTRRIQDVLNDRERALRNSHVLLLGVTYKADIADQRESPAFDIARNLLASGAKVSYHDPYVDSWAVDEVPIPTHLSLSEGLMSSDVGVLIQAHSSLDRDLMNSSLTPILDTRGLLKGPNIIRM